MRIKLVVILASLSLLACGIPYYKAGATKADYKRDKKYCGRMIGRTADEISLPTAEESRAGLPGATLAELSPYITLQDCLLTLGWSKEKLEPDTSKSD